MIRCVDADVVIENIDEWLETVGTAVIGKGLSYYYELLGCIEEAPTIHTAPVKHGHWIEHKRAEEFCGELISNWECSECHEWFREWGHYCSDCGTKMDGEPI